MERGERIALAEGFGAAYAAIDELLKGLDPAAQSFVPRIADAWSINDHLVHLLDADTAVWFRIRAAIAEPGLAIVPWDEEAWHARLHYEAMDGRACLETAKGMRRTLTSSLLAIAAEDWDRYFIVHPARGKMGLAELLVAYREHAAFHAPFVKRNRDAWKSRG